MGLDRAPRPAERLLEHPRSLRRHIQRALQAGSRPRPIWDETRPEDDGMSVVVFLLGLQQTASDQPPEPCLILNKRSRKVRQPGDICCPGGGVAPRFDRRAAHLLRLPLSPLRRWSYYSYWRKRSPEQMARLRLLMATALREGFEEMRLNPLAVSFQGMLPAEQLVMFRRTIVPMVAWVGGQRRFVPNWEVEKIVRIPMRALLAPRSYIRLRLTTDFPETAARAGEWKDFPAFRHRSAEGTEILWGATYRITMTFLHRVFGFRPPDPTRSDLVEKRLRTSYLTGKD